MRAYYVGKLIEGMSARRRKCKKTCTPKKRSVLIFSEDLLTT